MLLLGGCRENSKSPSKDFRIEDLAASIQQVLEEVATRYCDEWVRRSGIGNVALAGGVFANVRLNQRIHELDCVKSLFIHPGMGDEGLGVWCDGRQGE